jgi:hypothetical protein
MTMENITKLCAKHTPRTFLEEIAGSHRKSSSGLTRLDR